jgi:hypothetical protein
MQDVLILNQKLAHAFSYYDLEAGKELRRTRLLDCPHRLSEQKINDKHSLIEWGPSS